MSEKGTWARVLADSVCPEGIRLTTLLVRLPRIVLAELNTHRKLSRGCASSRAIPVEKRIMAMETDPFVPNAFAANQRGMVAGEALDAESQDEAKADWEGAMHHMSRSARLLASRGVHKQWANRLIEPFSYVEVIITATEWSNFFALRISPHAQPEIREAAEAMKAAMDASTPQPLDPNSHWQRGRWHLPLVDERDFRDVEVAGQVDANTGIPLIVKLSVARCARVSYLTHEGKRDIAADFRLHDQLVSNGHMCYDAATEVLTDGGWVAWPDVTPKHRLYAVDINSQLGHFETPSRLYSAEVDEPLYAVHGQALDLLVTHNHRMVVSQRLSTGWTPFRFETAAAVDGRGRRYLTSSSSVEAAAPPFPSDWEFDQTSLLKLLGFFIGDGSLSSRHRIDFHLKRQRKIDYLTSLNLPLRSGAGHHHAVSLPEARSWFSDNCYDQDGNKQIPAWVLTLSRTDILHVLSGLKNSDGSVKRNTWVYDSCSKQVVDMVQAMLSLIGQTGSLHGRPVPNMANDALIYRVNVTDRISPRVEPHQVGRARTYVEEWQNYCGKVYCATVSTGALLVRRNDKVVISGNSPMEHAAEPFSPNEWRQIRQVQDSIKIRISNKALARRLSTSLEFDGNFRGWTQYRKVIPFEADFGARPKDTP